LGPLQEWVPCGSRWLLVLAVAVAIAVALTRACAAATGLIVDATRRIDAAVRPAASLTRVARVDAIGIVPVTVVRLSGSVVTAARFIASTGIVAAAATRAGTTTTIIATACSCGARAIRACDAGRSIHDVVRYDDDRGRIDLCIRCGHRRKAGDHQRDHSHENDIKMSSIASPGSGSPVATAW